MQFVKIYSDRIKIQFFQLQSFSGKGLSCVSKVERFSLINNDSAIIFLNLFSL